MNSTLEILRYKFPPHVADQIFKYLIISYKHENIKGFTNLLPIHNILNIKKEPLAHWITTFEKVNQSENNARFVDAIQYRKSINDVLLNNHICLKFWRNRNRNRNIKIK